MAKEQELSLNPQKISGLCGRLMCCLAYEFDFYRDARQCLPRVGQRTETEQGPGRIAEVDVISNRITVELDEGGRISMEADLLTHHQPGCPHQTAKRSAAPPAEEEPEEDDRELRE
jgi:cell fate regulator YaaT (PSP1 superfamily)